MNSLCDTLQNTMTYLLSLFNDLYCTVRVMIQLIDADGAQPVVARKLAVVVESKPLALEVDDRAVIGIAVGWFHVDTHVGRSGTAAGRLESLSATSRPPTSRL